MNFRSDSSAFFSILEICTCETPKIFEVLSCVSPWKKRRLMTICSRSVRQAIASLTDLTVFIVSQRASSVRHADRILVLDDCRVIAQGTHEQLLSNCAVYQEIYASQFEPEEEVRA